MKPESVTEVLTPQSRCRFALAWSDITPPANIYHRMWGAAKHDRATGIHRPLRATVAVFESCAATSKEVGRQLILALDHCTLGFAEHQQLLNTVAEQTAQPRERLLIVFSHTHAAGLMGLERGDQPGGDLIPSYLEKVGEVASKLVSDALSRLELVQIVYGNGRCNLAANRDFFDPVRNQYVCGYNPTGPADDTVVVARVTNMKRELVGTIVNYACHPTTLAWENTQVSPDYIGAFREIVENETGAPCLFLQGASGELGPVEGYVGDSRVADRNGRQLGYAALSALVALPSPGTRFVYQGPVISGATLGAWAHVPLSGQQLANTERWDGLRWHEPLPYRPNLPQVTEVARKLEELRKDEDAARVAGDFDGAAECRAMVERTNRLLHRLSLLPPGKIFPLLVVIWRIGDAIWVGVQGEPYNIFQTELRRRFSGVPIIIAALAADWGASYLPPEESYGKGIYQENIAIVSAGSLEQLIQSVAHAIGKIGI